MIKENRLPHNKKEGILYGSIICMITVTFMIVLNTYLKLGRIALVDLPHMFKAFILLFIIAMLLETFVVSLFSRKMNAFFLLENDSFNAKILFTVLFTVIGMSFFMTWIAPYISSGFNISTISLTNFISEWPKNFGIVFIFELILAQPIARKVMVMIHTR